MRNVSVLLVASLAAVVLMGCPPTYPKCESDENCKEKGEVCVQGQCQECAADAHCKPGFVCDASKCVPKPECSSTKDCREGQKCQAGKCVTAGKEPGACATPTDCPSGQDCVEGRCAEKTSSGDDCSFSAVRFEFNEFSLTGESQTTLGKYADCIKKQGLRFTLEGHADERGTEEYNMQLSQKRAASVRKYLVDLGVAGGLLETVGYGENRPISNASTEAGWAANRRVEFKSR